MSVREECENKNLPDDVLWHQFANVSITMGNINVAINKNGNHNTSRKTQADGCSKVTCQDQPFKTLPTLHPSFVCVCVCVCVRARARVFVCVCLSVSLSMFASAYVHACLRT